MANAISFETAILEKKKIIVASLKPNPPIDIGRSVIALTTGIKIKK